MKALSLRQPWAWAVVHAGKTVENRRWNTAFRGEFLVHAAKGMTIGEYEDAGLWILMRRLVADVPARATLDRGGIIGIATLVDVIPVAAPLLSKQIAERHGADVRWWMQEQYGFVLRDVRPLPFVACKGALGFFGVPGEILAATETRP